jgi:deoxyribodipyrimidine photo-lyase
MRLMEYTVIWFRTDLRIDNNQALQYALSLGKPVLPVFIYDKTYFGNGQNSFRLSLISFALSKLSESLKQYGSDIIVFEGSCIQAWAHITEIYKICGAVVSRDYSPAWEDTDKSVSCFLASKNINFISICGKYAAEPGLVLKNDGNPYTVYSFYKKKWLENYRTGNSSLDIELLSQLLVKNVSVPDLPISLADPCSISLADWKKPLESSYAIGRDYPASDSCSGLSAYFSSGMVSVKSVLSDCGDMSGAFASELIWRDLFGQILYYFPETATEEFNKKLRAVQWRYCDTEFAAWRNGLTGYPLVDAGMRQLASTGFMHNRVRMVCASFLCKHLLFDWRIGEAYFANMLMDYEAASNIGNWQWVAGTGCDAAPYFRVFSPEVQQRKFDKMFGYVKRWIPEFGTVHYPPPIVNHVYARERAIKAYSDASKKLYGNLI